METFTPVLKVVAVIVHMRSQERQDGKRTRHKKKKKKKKKKRKEKYMCSQCDALNARP
jgi:hypothetical protein